MNEEFEDIYKSAIRNHAFSVSKAIIKMLEDNEKLNHFVRGDFELAVNFAIDAWNLAIINDEGIIEMGVTSEAKKLKNRAGKNLKQTKDMLYSLIKTKNILYKNVYRLISNYSTAPDAQGRPHLKVVSGQDMPPDYFAHKYREGIFNKIRKSRQPRL